jgi:putative addiction module antidote
MQALKVTQVGNSLGIILPKEVLARLKVGKGDQLFFTDAPDGMRVTNADPLFEQQMAVARVLMKQRRNVLRELAK